MILLLPKLSVSTCDMKKFLITFTLSSNGYVDIVMKASYFH